LAASFFIENIIAYKGKGAETHFIRYAPVFSLISAVFRQMLVIKERRCFLLYACPDEKGAVSCSAPSILYLNTMHC